MKTRSIALAVVAMALCMAPAFAQDTAGVIAHQDGDNVFSGNSNYFMFDGTIARPPRPTATAGATTGGACLSTRSYILYVSYENATGETQISPPSYEFFPASGSTNIITVTRPAIGENVNTWTAWFSDSSTNYQTIRGCSTNGAITDTSAATTTVSCLCGTATDPTEPTTNTTNSGYVLKVNTSPSTLSVLFWDPLADVYYPLNGSGSSFGYTSGTVTTTSGAISVSGSTTVLSVTVVAPATNGDRIYVSSTSPATTSSTPLIPGASIPLATFGATNLYFISASGSQTAQIYVSYQ